MIRQSMANYDSQKKRTVSELTQIAKTMRRDILTMITEAKSGHPGGSLSCVELVAALYFSEMVYDPKKPQLTNRDRFVLSKGHGVPTVYAAMAEAGFFDKQELMTLRKTGARLQGHPDPARVPGIEASTGSLGQGLSIAQGFALASQLENNLWHTYCLMGDGELQEGQVWEAAMSIPHFKLNNLTAIIDYNKGQIDGPTNQVMGLEPLADKWRAFGWHVEVIDGHSLDQILQVYRAARNNKTPVPHCIIANTIKGKGVSFMEGKIGWHGVAPTQDELKTALGELL